jgi:Rab GDP dissociation inhibitor
VAAKDKYIAFVSTTVETNTPEMELSPGLTILGEVQEKFVFVSDIKAPLADGAADQCFISTGYDATSHFETTIDDVLDMYTRVTGEKLDVSSPIVDKLES